MPRGHKHILICSLSINARLSGALLFRVWKGVFLMFDYITERDSGKRKIS